MLAGGKLVTVNKIRKKLCVELNPSFHGLLALYLLGHLVGVLLIALSPNLPTLFCRTRSRAELSEADIIAIVLLL